MKLPQATNAMSSLLSTGSGIRGQVDDTLRSFFLDVQLSVSFLNVVGSDSSRVQPSFLTTQTHQHRATAVNLVDPVSDFGFKQ